jgi:hypothetical protein
MSWQRNGYVDGYAQMSFAQQRLWFLDQLVPNNPLYNRPGAIRLEGRLELEVLERVINEIVRRHEVLRTGFEYSARAIELIETTGVRVIHIPAYSPDFN